MKRKKIGIIVAVLVLVLAGSIGWNVSVSALTLFQKMRCKVKKNFAYDVSSFRL